MNRGQMLAAARERSDPWDLVIIGGGASGVAVALDAAARGHAVLLLEQDDLGKGTSSRSTKLVHGGVRYLQQGNVALVMEALRERGRLRRNAPHLVHDLRFVVPNYVWWETPFYGIGLKVYDMLAGRYGFGKSAILSLEETLAAIPTLKTDGLRGGVSYHDGQFDDARLLLALAHTAVEQGALLVTRARVTALQKNGAGLVRGVLAQDLLGGGEIVARARVVINATGPFTDAVRALDEPGAAPMIAPSQGVHLVLPREFLPGDSAIMVPHTRDGRIMFALPWHDRTLVGTTDTPVAHAELEPRALDEEIDLILDTAGGYLSHAPERSDILSVFAGIRPLVKAGDGSDTAGLSRDHTVHISPSGLVTLAGGKWTTARHMAEDCVDHAAAVGGLPERPSVTRTLSLHGHHAHSERFGELSLYGSDAPEIKALWDDQPKLSRRLHARLPYRAAEVIWAVREELALCVEDVLSRRTRALLLDARAAMECAPQVAELMAAELGHDEAWVRQQVTEFCALAESYLPD